MDVHHHHHKEAGLTLPVLMQVKQTAEQSRLHILQLLNPDVLRPSSWSTINLLKPHTLYKARRKGACRLSRSAPARHHGMMGAREQCMHA